MKSKSWSNKTHASLNNKAKAKTKMKIKSHNEEKNEVK